MQKIFLFVVVIATLVLRAGAAAEIDSVTPRKVKLPDSLELINAIINQRLQQGVENANEQREYIEEIDEYITSENYCDEDSLYTELRKAI